MFTCQKKKKDEGKKERKEKKTLWRRREVLPEGHWCCDQRCLLVEGCRKPKNESTAVTSRGYDLSDSHFPLLRIKNRPLYYDWLLSAWWFIQKRKFRIWSSVTGVGPNGMEFIFSLEQTVYILKIGRLFFTRVCVGLLRLTDISPERDPRCWGAGRKKG